MKMIRIIRQGSVLGTLLMFFSRSGAAQSAEKATFYLVAGTDTLVVERMARLPNRLDLELYDTQRLGRATIAATLATSGLVTDADASFFASDRDTVPLQYTRVRFVGDSVGFLSGVTLRWLHVGKNAIPMVNPSSALLEQLLIRARDVQPASKVELSYIFLPAGPEVPAEVAWVGSDSAVLHYAGVEMRLHVSPTGRLLGGVVPSQGVRILRGAATSGPFARGRSYAPPADAPYTAEEVTVRTKSGLALAGTLTKPKMASGRRSPAVVTITGTGPQDRDEGIPGLKNYALFREVADTLGRRGIAVLRLDDRGVGGSDRGPANITTADFADDIRAAVAFLRSRPEIDPGRIGLIGHSEGGIIGPMVAATDSAIAAVVIMAGSVSPGREILEFQQRFVVDSMQHLLGQQRDAALAQYAHNTDSVVATIPWFAYFVHYDAAATAARVRAPVLILHGAKDYQVPVSEAEKVAAAIRNGGNRDVTVRIFPATNHLFVDDAGVGFAYDKLPSLSIRPEVLGAISDWLVARLKP